MKGVPVDWRKAPRNVAVFRALNLGDMLCAMPALRALRMELPASHITLIGLESAVPVMRHFSDYLDELIEFPGDEAFPEQPVRDTELPAFYDEMRSRRFDLALQMHGSGNRSNEIVKAMKPAQWAGFVPDPRQAEPGRLMPWPEDLHEVHRYLALLRHLGLKAEDDRLAFPITQQDRRQAAQVATEYGLRLDRAVFMHPGARLASRRWPLERYAAVARVLSDSGWQVIVTGGASEVMLAQALSAQAGPALVNLCGATSLGDLAVLLQRGRLLVCNDTGISHVAAAVGAPSVVIACGSQVTRWAPLDTRRHTVLHASVACRPCAYDECPVGHACALKVTVDEVLKCVGERLSRSAS